MTERKKKWKRKGADSPLGSNNINEAEEENEIHSLANGNGKSPLKQLDPANSTSPSAHSTSKSLNKDGEAKEIAENGHILHEMIGNGASKQSPVKGKLRSNGNSHESAGNDNLLHNSIENDHDQKKSTNGHSNGEASSHEHTSKIPFSARRQNRSPSSKESPNGEQNKEAKFSQDNSGYSHDISSSGVSKESKLSIPPEIKSEAKNEVPNSNGGDDVEAMMLFESFLSNVQNENSQPLPGSDNDEKNKQKKRKQFEDDASKNRISKLLADESLDDRPKRARKPTKLEEFDPDFDENEGEAYSPSNGNGSANKKTPVKEGRNGADKLTSPNRKTPIKKEPENSKKTPKKKKPQEEDDEDDYDKQHTITSPGKFIDGYDLGIDPARPKRQRKQLSNFKEEDLDEFEEFQEPPPRKKTPKEKSKKNAPQVEETNGNDSPKTSPKEDKKKSAKANFGRINRPRLGEIPELEHKKVFCQNKTGIIIGTNIRCDCCSKMYTAGEFERHAGLLVARNPYKTIIVTESGKCLDTYRYCTCCHTTETDYWDDGPYGTRTLCSSCGNKYRDGKITEIFLKKLVETSKGVDCRPANNHSIPKKSWSGSFF